MSTAEIDISNAVPFNVSIPAKVLSFVKPIDLAMDLGTANTLIYAKGKGILLNEPSIVAIEQKSGKILAIGHTAREMYGKAPSGIRCIRPMRDGVIADFEVTAAMIGYMLKKASQGFSLSRPRIVIGVPSGITQVEKRAVIDAASRAGVKNVMLTEEPMAAALGSGMPVDKAVGNMIIDIGGGTTEVAILSLNQTLYSHSIRVAGDEMDEAIQRYFKKEHNLEMSIVEAERLKFIIGSAMSTGKLRKTVAYGRELSTGMPKKIEADDHMIRHAIKEPVEAIISSVIAALEQTNPEIAHDIVARGVYLAGGGALLGGLAERLHRETGIEFKIAQDPLSCVVRGVGRIVDDLKNMKVLCIA